MPIGVAELSGWDTKVVNFGDFRTDKCVCYVVVIPECHSLLFIYLGKLRTVVICHCVFINMVVGIGWV